MRDESKGALSGVITISARLKSEWGAVDEVLRGIPYIKVISSGPVINCKIDDAGTAVSFFSDKIELFYALGGNPKRDYAANLLKMIALLEHMPGLYEISCASLFGCLNIFLPDYIAPEICAPPRVSNPELLIRRIEQVSEMNAALFEAVGQMKSLQTKQAQDIETLKGFSSQILRYVSSRIRSDGVGVPEATGISEALVSKVSAIIGAAKEVEQRR